jgi:hypothetical protein
MSWKRSLTSTTWGSRAVDRTSGSWARHPLAPKAGHIPLKKPGILFPGCCRSAGWARSLDSTAADINCYRSVFRSR